jgi:hypothetical protein
MEKLFLERSGVGVGTPKVRGRRRNAKDLEFDFVNFKQKI